jgi:hypothetical protein
MRSYLLVGLVVVIVAAGVLGWSHLATAAGDKPASGTVVAPSGSSLDNPIVTVLPGTAETTYQQDPFNPTLLKQSTMRVRSLLVVHADGRVETKSVQ